MKQRITKEQLAARTPAARRLYATGEYTQKEIGARFGMCVVTVSQVVRAQTPEAREARHRVKQTRRSARHDAMGQDWKTGDYTLEQLSKKWHCSRDLIRIGLKEAGTSGKDKQYKHRRVRELYAAGQSREALAERYGVSEHWIARIIWRASDAPQRTCLFSQCGNQFRPKSRVHLFCKTHCRVQHKRLEKVCAVCAGAFRTNDPGQRTCSHKCNGVWLKIQSIDRGLRLRELKRAGCSDALIIRKTGFSKATIIALCARGRRGTYLAAIEALKKHSGDVALSPAAESIVGWAWGVLIREGLDRHVRTQIIGSADS